MLNVAHDRCSHRLDLARSWAGVGVTSVTFHQKGIPPQGWDKTDEVTPGPLRNRSILPQCSGLMVDSKLQDVKSHYCSSDSQGPEGKLRYKGNGFKSRRVKVPFANDLGGGMKNRGFPQRMYRI